MSKTVTYRTITVAIGIAVAALIAFTLWIGAPRKDSLTGFQASPPSMLHTAKNFLKTVIDVGEYRP